MEPFTCFSSDDEDCDYKPENDDENDEESSSDEESDEDTQIESSDDSILDDDDLPNINFEADDVNADVIPNASVVGNVGEEAVNQIEVVLFEKLSKL